MRKELPYFNIGASYGGNQDWFRELSMRLGGCAAETACDMCIYLDLYKGFDLYPFDVNKLSKADYIAFASVMKPYLHPRFGGINKLSVFAQGFDEYIKSAGGNIRFSLIGEDYSPGDAKRLLKEQIDSGFPVAYLCLQHKNKRFKDYEWHWFVINGYDENEKGFSVKAVTYSAYEWLDFDELRNTGCVQRGGMVIINPEDTYEIY